MRPLLLENALVIGMNGPDDLTPGGDVLVEDGAITALHAAARDGARALENELRPVDRWDASGLWLLPGFVQTHVHLCQTLLRNGPDDRELLPWLQDHVWPGEAAHTADTMEVSARLGLAELLEGGTTAILDMGTVRHTDAIFRMAADSGMRVASGNALMDDPSSTPPALLEATDAGLEETDRLADRWHGAENGRLRVAYCPRFAVSCTERCLTEVAYRASARGLLVHTHASESGGEVALVRERTGRENLRYLADVGISGENVVLAHVIHTEAEERLLLSESRTAVAHCPSSNLKLGSGICPVPEYLSLGIRMGIGADGAPCNDRLDVFTEMRLAALLPKIRLGPSALPAWEVVRMATAGGAEAIGLGDVAGTISVGKRADLVLLDPESGFALPNEWRDDPYGPIVYTFDRSHVVATFVDGILRHRRGSGILDPLKPAPSEIRRAVTTLRAGRA